MSDLTDGLAESLKLETVRFLQYFWASKSFSELYSGGPAGTEPLSDLENYAVADSTRALLAVASGCRVIMDRHKARHGTWPMCHSPPCGSLVRDTANPDQIGPLSLREACNKLIHATEARFETTAAPVTPRVDPSWIDVRASLPIIHLEGTFQRKRWTARVDIEPFAIAVCKLLDESRI